MTQHGGNQSSKGVGSGPRSWHDNEGWIEGHRWYCAVGRSGV